MRISITIPDSLYREIKKNYREIGFNTVNDFILDCIRRHEILHSKLSKIRGEDYENA